MPAMTAEPRRRDLGRPRITERDLEVFRWLAEMKAMYEPDLAVLIGRLTGQRPSASAVRSLIARWQPKPARPGIEGWPGVADAAKLIATQPRIVRLLPNGGRLVGEDNFGETSEFTAYHQADVSRVRLYIEGRREYAGGVIEWVSERRLRQQNAGLFLRGEKQDHVPDALIRFANGEWAALEVERSVKAGRRLRDYIGQMSGYNLIIYAVASEPIARAVKEAHSAVQEAARKEGRTRFAELKVIDIPADLRE
jgi:hypothetical protein